MDAAIRSLVIGSLLSGCSHARPSLPSSIPGPVTAPAAEAKVQSWTPRLMIGTSQYSFRDSSTVSISNDTTSQSLPIETTLNYKISITSLNDSFSLLGTIDSLTINSRLHTKNASADSLKADEFHGVISKQGRLVPSSEEKLLNCSRTSNAMVSRVYELVIPYSIATVKVGDTWSDTVSNTACHGRTPLTQQSIRIFKVINFAKWHEQSAVEIQRNSQIVFTGASTETNTHLSAKGSGTSESTLIIDQTSASLLESSGNTKSTLVITTSRGEFPFTQFTSTHIVKN